MTSRLPIVIVLVASLLCVGAARWWTSNLRDDRTTAAEAEGLGRLDSFALGLVLGGLRGPLVMALWTSSETQKTERDLTDIDTKIELIRLLQPEFDTVHLFQIWNKAYNLSVQMANLPNKYAVILDALDYAFAVDAERPDNVNMQAAIAGVFFNKLGESAEKLYYRQRLMDETRPPTPATRVTFPADRRDELVAAARQAGADPAQLFIRTERIADDDATADAITTRPAAASSGQLTVTVDRAIAERMRPSFAGEGVEYVDRSVRDLVRDDTGRRLKYDTLLDADGGILPRYLDPAGEADGVGELGHLEPFEPFDDGVSPFALAYNYYRKAQYLQNERGQQHAQLSDRVIDSRPALSLLMWAQEQHERGRRAELAALALPVPEDEYEREAPAADLPLAPDFGEGGASRPLLERAAGDYLRGATVAEAADEAFGEHVERFLSDEALYRSQIDWSRALGALLTGDGQYLRGALADPADAAARSAAAAASAEAYRQVIPRLQALTLRYYVAEPILAVALPPGTIEPGMDKFAAVDKLVAAGPEAVGAAYARAVAAMDQPANEAFRTTEVAEYQSYMSRAATRLEQLEGAAVARN